MASETFYLEYPPFPRDPISVITQEEYAEDLPANHRYERVEVPSAEFATVEALDAWVAAENQRRVYPTE